MTATTSIDTAFAAENDIDRHGWRAVLERGLLHFAIALDPSLLPSLLAIEDQKQDGAPAAEEEPRRSADPFVNNPLHLLF